MGENVDIRFKGYHVIGHVLELGFFLSIRFVRTKNARYLLNQINPFTVTWGK